MFGGRLDDALERAFLASPEGRRQIEFFANLPDSAVAAGFSAWWEEGAIRAAGRREQVVRVPVADYRFVLDVRWRPDHETMNEARAHGPSSGPWREAMATDLRWPIILGRRPDRWTVLDGYHRLLKADLLRHRTIAAVRLPRERITEALVDTPFFGDLNRLWVAGHELLLEPARRVACHLSS